MKCKAIRALQHDQRHERIEQDSLIAWIDHQTLGARIRQARAQPFCSNFALVVAAEPSAVGSSRWLPLTVR